MCVFKISDVQKFLMINYKHKFLVKFSPSYIYLTFDQHRKEAKRYKASKLSGNF